MQVGSSGAGGTFVPPGFQREIIEAQKAYGGLENVARTINTPMGNDMDVPTADDTANQGSIVGEASTISNTTSVPTGQITLESVKYQSGPVLYSIEMEQDSFTDINSFLRDKLGDRLGRVFASHIAQRSSTEANGPHGITNISTGAVAITQGTTGVNPATLRDLIHSVDPAYRGRNNVAFLMNDNTLKNFAKLEDADGRPLWQPSLQQGVPDQILGYPVQVDQNIPTATTTGSTLTKPVFFGDMNSYAVRRVMDMRTFELRERFIQEGNFGLIAFQRADGRPLSGSTTPAQKPIRAMVATT
jgi:HK97 family phage major capsid protein